MANVNPASITPKVGTSATGFAKPSGPRAARLPTKVPKTTATPAPAGQEQAQQGIVDPNEGGGGGFDFGSFFKSPVGAFLLIDSLRQLGQGIGDAAGGGGGQVAGGGGMFGGGGGLFDTMLKMKLLGIDPSEMFNFGPVPTLESEGGGAEQDPFGQTGLAAVQTKTAATTGNIQGQPSAGPTVVKGRVQFGQGADKLNQRAARAGRGGIAGGIRAA